MTDTESSAKRPRAREIGLVVGDLATGRHNTITDVPGVRVGHATLWTGEGPLRPGEGPVRTGVTVIRPHGGNLFRECGRLSTRSTGSARPAASKRSASSA
jgi:D-aminopeptidase